MIRKIFKALLPQTRPTAELGMLLRIASEAGVNVEREVCIIGLRGYYNPGQNQRAIYDDAIFILAPHKTKAFNANCDASVFRKAVANLKPGVWWYKLGIHGLSKPKSKQYQALVQFDKVTVIRDQVGPDTGFFGINIHRGSYTGTSSLGCQTIHPSQWDEFISTVKQYLTMYGQTKLRYILKEVKDDLD